MSHTDDHLFHTLGPEFPTGLYSAPAHRFGHQQKFMD